MTARGVPSRGAQAALAGLLAYVLLSLSACANSYAGISFAPGAADPELQSLARRAQAGDKQAQLELGKAYEEGRGVAPDLKRAKLLYRQASTSRGGVRLAYVPAVGGKGRGATVPISGGKLMPGLPEAASRLAELQSRKAPSPGPVQADRRFFPDSATGRGSGPLEQVLFTIVRIEMASDSCFPVSPERESLDAYSDRVWRCIVQTRLPEDCTQSSDAILRTARFIRFNPNFALLHGSANDLVDRCVASGRRSMNDVYASRTQANFLDLVILNLSHATETQIRFVEMFTGSYETHAPRHAPVLQFADTMCRRLMAGTPAEPASFWLLFCNSGNIDFTDRADRSRLIDNSILGKGVYGWSN